MIEEWMRMLLDRNGISSESELTRKMIEEELSEVEGTIANEDIWAVGSNEDDEVMHVENSEHLRDYADYLGNLLLTL